jgi:hypothetical protein
VQHVEGRQAGDRAKLIGVERLPVHQPAPVLERLDLAGERGDRLRGHDRVALHEGQRDRPLEQLLELGGAGLLGGPLGEAILDHPEGGVGLGEP